LSGQDKYLKGATLQRRPYTRREHIDSRWDDDHCEFCRALFMADNFPDTLHEGYTTANQYHWICDDCFGDFREMFGWKLVS
jgi:hypothetical protein